MKSFSISIIFLCILPNVLFSQAIVSLDMQNHQNQGYFDKWEAQVNARNMPLPSETVKTDAGFYNGASFSYERSHEEGLEVVTSSLTGKKALRATLVDGRSYNGGTYDRAELNLNGKPGGNFKVGRLMQVTWSGYFEKALPSVKEFVVAMQLHGHDVISPANGVYIRGTMVSFRDRLVTGWHDFMSVSEMVNKVVTFKMTINCNDTNGYLKFEYQKEGSAWVTVMERNTSATKNPDGTSDNYIKLAGLYDYYRTLVDPNQYSRGNSFSLMTTNATIADITNGAVTIQSILSNPVQPIKINAAHDTLIFSYILLETTQTVFSVYDLRGQLLKSQNQELSGSGLCTMNISSIANNELFIVKISTGNISYFRKMAIVG